MTENEYIDLLENLRATLKLLYNEKPEEWAENYTDALHELAYQYNYSDRGSIDEIVALAEEAFEIMQPLYHKNPERWAEAYTDALNGYALSLEIADDIGGAISWQEDSLKILGPLWNRNPECWGNSYAFALGRMKYFYDVCSVEPYGSDPFYRPASLHKDFLESLKSLYDKNPEHWAERYVVELNKVEDYGTFFIDDRMEPSEEAYKIIKPLYHKEPERWAELYSSTVDILIRWYERNKRYDEASALEKEVRATV